MKNYMRGYLAWVRGCAFVRFKRTSRVILSTEYHPKTSEDFEVSPKIKNNKTPQRATCMISEVYPKTPEHFEVPPKKIKTSRRAAWFPKFIRRLSKISKSPVTKNKQDFSKSYMISEDHPKMFLRRNPMTPPKDSRSWSESQPRHFQSAYLLQQQQGSDHRCI